MSFRSHCQSGCWVRALVVTNEMFFKHHPLRQSGCWVRALVVTFEFFFISSSKSQSGCWVRALVVTLVFIFFNLLCQPKRLLGARTRCDICFI